MTLTMIPYTFNSTGLFGHVSDYQKCLRSSEVPFDRLKRVTRIMLRTTLTQVSL